MGLCAPEKSLILHKFYNIQHGRMIFFYQTGDEYNVFGMQIIFPTYSVVYLPKHLYHMLKDEVSLELT